MKLSDFRIRDPFLLPVAERGSYYLFGTTNKSEFGGVENGFNCYRSRDLVEWEGPFLAFNRPDDFWATKDFWAAEVHAYRGRFYMLATFKADGVRRGTQILAADDPLGPYVPWSDGPVTPRDWECLDGTLHVDAAGVPWMVFCHEWVQIADGTMDVVRLSDDLRSAVGESQMLFRASSAPWARAQDADPSKADKTLTKPAGDIYITDGPFLHRAPDGTLLMLWSSFGEQGYAMAFARSTSGTVHGPWVQEREPLWTRDGGHGMIFRSFEGELFVTLHQPNKSPEERAVFRRISFDGATARLE